MSAVAEWKPELVADTQLWPLFTYLTLGSYLHREIKALQLPLELLADLTEALTSRVMQRRTFPDGLKLLERMQVLLGNDKDGQFRFGWSEHQAGSHPRLVSKLALPCFIEEAVTSERRRRPSEKTLLVRDRLSSNKLRARTKASNAEHERALDAAAEALCVDQPYEITIAVAQHLDRVSVRSFNKTIADNWDAAVAAIDQRFERDIRRAEQAGSYAHSSEIDLASQRKELRERQLGALAISSKPRYATKPNSARLFPLGSSLCSQTSDIRRALTGDWIEVDLEAMNIGAAPRFLDVPVLEDFLSTGASIWIALIEDLGLREISEMSPEAFDVIKSAMKHDGLYPGLNGRKDFWMRHKVVGTLRSKLAATLGLKANEAAQIIPDEVGKRFVNHPFVAELMEGSGALLGRIRETGFAYDHHGQKVGLPVCDGSVDYRLRGDASPATLLSFLFSRVEMDLMKAVIDLEQAQKGSRFNVMLWQHDGATIRIKKPNHFRPDMTLAQIQDAVAKKASELGVYTRLKIDHDPRGFSIG